VKHYQVLVQYEYLFINTTKTRKISYKSLTVLVLMLLICKKTKRKYYKGELFLWSYEFLKQFISFKTVSGSLIDCIRQLPVSSLTAVMHSCSGFSRVGQVHHISLLVVDVSRWLFSCCDGS